MGAHGLCSKTLCFIVVMYSGELLGAKRRERMAISRCVLIQKLLVAECGLANFAQDRWFQIVSILAYIVEKLFARDICVEIAM